MVAKVHHRVFRPSFDLQFTPFGAGNYFVYGIDMKKNKEFQIMYLSAPKSTTRFEGCVD